MTRNVLVVPAVLAVMSVAVRVGMWLVVIGSASVLVLWLLVRWQLRRWCPVAVALWAVTGSDVEDRFVGELAVMSFGDRRALRVAACRCSSSYDAAVAVERIDAAGRVLDLVAVPDCVRPRRRTHVFWCAVGSIGLVGSAVTGSGWWLSVALLASTGGVVAWSWWGLVTRGRPAGLAQVARRSVNANTAARPAAIALELVSRSPRPGVLLTETDDVIERADMPLRERHRAQQQLADLRGVSGRTSVRAVPTIWAVALVGVVAPWVTW